MSNEIIIQESFEDIEEEIIVDKDEFNSREIAELKIKANELVSDNEINELISYPKIKKNLTYNLPHQTDGALKILRDFNCNTLLADEVGLGKTITTGIVIKESIERGMVKKILILTPPSLVDQWVAELDEKFEIKFKIIESEKDWEDTDYAIASIDRVKIFNRETGDFRHKAAHEIPWDLLIVDEAHKLKDRRSIRTRFVDKIQKKRFLILTATPFQNDLIELYNLLNLLKKGHLGTIQSFRKNFLEKGNKRKPVQPEELKRKLKEVMVRRRRNETTVSYTNRIPRTISIELSDQEKIIYDEIHKLIKSNYFLSSGMQINGKLAIYAILPKITSSSKSAIESLQKIVDNPERYHECTREHAQKILDEYSNLKKDSKIEKLAELIKDIYDEDRNQKVLIYTKHPTTLKYIVEKLKPLNLKIVEFTGASSREEKSEIIKEFKENSDIMISTETGCEGLNFQFCNNLINYDLPWNPMAVEQRIGRIDRIGQTRDMNIFSLATKDTIEEHVIDLIINKMCCVGLVIGELPVILFNLGLDGKGEFGSNKIEEMIMNQFIDSKNNLKVFSKGIKEIEKVIQGGIDSHLDSKKTTSELLDKK
ncbi:DEAD/DEAH box helicase [archaeon]|jgi:SNF2 family DNA or RNA helicase|nr:DEAD/DEAH box helicase [archaeon]MBT4241594.1 DEAD/DEAH box helicase [archaeon]MBT4417989.1 DEAD/DEAH box helicase [archaeon]